MWNFSSCWTKTSDRYFSGFFCFIFQIFDDDYKKKREDNSRKMHCIYLHSLVDSKTCATVVKIKERQSERIRNVRVLTSVKIIYCTILYLHYKIVLKYVYVISCYVIYAVVACGAPYICSVISTGTPNANCLNQQKSFLKLISISPGVESKLCVCMHLCSFVLVLELTKSVW